MIKNLRKKGFTIVELVIVIAVIAILAAILIPTFTSVVQKANDSAVQSELKSAYTQYVTLASDDEGYQDGYLNLIFEYSDSSSKKVYYQYNGNVFSKVDDFILDVGNNIVEYYVESAVEAQDAIFGSVTIYTNN